MKKLYDRAIIIYDGGCPACKYYTSIIQLKERAEHTELLNARENIPIDIMKLLPDGISFDDGMVLILDEKVYFGADAISKISEHAHSKNFAMKIFNNINKNKLLSKCLYPFLKLGRHCLLKVLRRKKIVKDE